jgi:hypothetical protein
MRMVPYLAGTAPQELAEELDMELIQIMVAETVVHTILKKAPGPTGHHQVLEALSSKEAHMERHPVFADLTYPAWQQLFRRVATQEYPLVKVLRRSGGCSV